uniref:C3H1-type domain-containing protein n=1 Tax=Aceria tosichella TaxID=561515 RepID=A0A6G1SIC8_9ACAR
MNRAKVIRMLRESAAASSPSPDQGQIQVQTEPKTLFSPIPEQNKNATADKISQAPRSSLTTILETTQIENGCTTKPDTSKAPKTDEDELEMFDRWDPMAEDFHSSENTLTLDPDKDPECVVTGKMVEDCIMIGKHRVCEFYLKHGTCADGNYCNRLHVHPSARDKIHELQRESEMNTSKTRMISSYLSPIELQPNDQVLLLVSITMITSPTRFYFVAPYEQMNFAGFNDAEVNFYIGRVQHSSSIKTKLQKCHEQLASLFDHNYRVDSLKDALCIGQMVACKLDDGRFCRATILDNRDKDEVECYYKLFLIDIGIEVSLTRDAIYEIRASCLSEPPMAILGRLGLKPANGELRWSREASALFEKFTTKNKYMLCKVISHWAQDDIFTIDLISINDHTSITELMLARNLAERMTL